MNNKTFLITRPAHDLITNYLLHWSKQLVDMATEKGVAVIDLERDKVAMKEVSGRLAKTKPHLVMLNGHGNEVEIAGQDLKTLININNTHLLSGSITYARACSSAHTLGRVAVENGTRAYIGYTKPFHMFYNKDKVNHPLQDEVATLFLEPSNRVITSLLKGHTAKQASERSKRSSMQSILRLMSSDASPEEKVYARFLLHNMRSQTCLGDNDATI